MPKKRVEVKMKTPTQKKVGEAVMSRHDVEVISRVAREHGERLLRLKEAYLSGDRTPLSESDVVREAVGVPKAKTE